MDRLAPPVARPDSTSAIVGCHVGREVEVVGQVARGSRSTASVLTPARRNAVGQRPHRGRLAGPALWESTAIVCLSVVFAREAVMERDTYAPRPGRPQPALCRAPEAAVRARAGRDADEAPACSGRPGSRRRPGAPAVRPRALDPRAVHEHAVEAAIVEHPDAVGLTHDQGMAARDGRVVEAHVRREAAPHARPLACQRDRLQLPRRLRRPRYSPGSSSRARASSSQASLSTGSGRDNAPPAMPAFRVSASLALAHRRRARSRRVVGARIAAAGDNRSRAAVGPGHGRFGLSGREPGRPR